MSRVFGLSTSAAILSGLLGMLFGSGAYTFHYGEGLSYLSDQPAACVNCHIMRDQHDGWQKAGHHAYATCNDCHTPHELPWKYIAKAEHGFWHSKGFTLQDFHEPIRIHEKGIVDVNRNCLRCHSDLVDHIAFGSSLEEGAEVSNCVHCHAHVGHGPSR